MRGLFCCLISVFLSGFQILGAMEAKPKAEVLQTAKILELPDELISEIILFSLGDGGVSEIESKKYLVKPGKILRKWLLVSKRFHNIVLNQICVHIIPGIKNNESLWNKPVPYDALSLVLEGVDATIDGYVCSEFRKKISKKFMEKNAEKMSAENEFETLILAYLLANQNSSISQFAYDKSRKFFDEILVEAQKGYRESILTALSCVKKIVDKNKALINFYGLTNLNSLLTVFDSKLNSLIEKHRTLEEQKRKNEPLHIDTFKKELDLWLLGLGKKPGHTKNKSGKKIHVESRLPWYILRADVD